ncbi:TlpA disulfide reductase family protein [Nocardioides mangrovi]|uniref:TlpA family protein disulfide reductase n=1 Tax=Nocardioides mangrovi TaxID=2874580 RepID=A0ABS7UEU6_9ACTN|nr:TlpA disulfide reductase family protein [Nocardioides mangrovi]MBZ5739292.1 TlpA family protein disulfide reductase [Nocardioides mangrovi]
MIRRGVGAALVGVLALGGAGCTSLQGSGDKGYVSGDGSLTLVARPERADPIVLSGEDLDGKELDLADFRGKPVVVPVWGSWCGPCNGEAPDLVAAAKELGDEATFVGINVRDGSAAQARSFVKSYDVPYRSFYSPDSKALLAFTGTLTTTSTPATVVLDADGRVAASVLGTIPSTQTLVDVVRDVEKESADG